MWELGLCGVGKGSGIALAISMCCSRLGRRSSDSIKLTVTEPWMSMTSVQMCWDLAALILYKESLGS